MFCVGVAVEKQVAAGKWVGWAVVVLRCVGAPVAPGFLPAQE